MLKMDLGERLATWQQHGVDLVTRRVMFHHHMGAAEDVHEIGVDHVVRSILFLDSLGDDPIELWINSPGGDMCEAWGLFDAMQTADSEVITVGFGEVASAACMILAGGTGKRYVHPGTQFMWHQGTTGVRDDLAWMDAKHRMAWEERDFQRWCELMGRLTTKPASYWSDKSSGELWLNAEEMLEHGIVDALVESRWPDAPDR